MIMGSTTNEEILQVRFPPCGLESKETGKASPRIALRFVAAARAWSRVESERTAFHVSIGPQGTLSLAQVESANRLLPYVS